LLTSKHIQGDPVLTSLADRITLFRISKSTWRPCL